MENSKPEYVAALSKLVAVGIFLQHPNLHYRDPYIIGLRVGKAGTAH